MNAAENNFCGTHRKRRALREEIDRHPDDPFAKSYEHMFSFLSSKQSKNPLKPCFPCAPSPGHSAKSLSEFVDAMKPYKGLLRALLEPTADTEKRWDQKMRAKLVAQIFVLHEELTSLCLMDGFGGFTLQILSQIKKVCPRFNELELVLCDLDPKVIQYHESFFPTFVTHLHCDITTLPPHPKCLDYFNFCGLGDSFDPVKVCVEQRTKSLIPFVLSFSTGRSAKDREDPFSKNPSLKKMQSSRGDFVTFFSSHSLSSYGENKPSIEKPNRRVLLRQLKQATKRRVSIRHSRSFSQMTCGFSF